MYCKSAIQPFYEYQNATNCWHINSFEQDKFHTRLSLNNCSKTLGLSKTAYSLLILRHIMRKLASRFVNASLLKGKKYSLLFGCCV